ncbi:hypothetical protein BKA04_001882 [Cryobacterium mesophilum]|uniref:Uncharacterized protein n=1 Tax=Terrimesophilobacter mesophilus TaxID=433647 RepID=A0A4R8VAR4_9MICO|nr:hypothetical protein [Terrimesophilobacter mesophilus]MBB5633659.1 hypothetical protein [Terrimesophilobacter mesophilus]TFB80351.1 hypothetical protein E3N84_10115 [Terrimesophilobacter mesophilus]
MSEHPASSTRGHGTLQRIAEPWTLVVIVTALFHFFRGAPVDGALFLIIAILLLADGMGWVRLRVPDVRLPSLATLAGCAVVLGTLLVLAPRHGVVEGLIVSAIGVFVLVVSWDAAGGPSEHTRPLRNAIILFTAVGVIGCLIEVTSYLLGLRSPEAMFEHPSISLLLDPYVDTLAGRIVFTGLWLLAGIWFLRRSRRSDLEQR